MSNNTESAKLTAKIRRKVKPGQTPEEELKQIDKLVQDWAVGFKQELQGEATNQFVEEYLDCFAEETRKEIEGAVEMLYSLKTFDRFRRRMITMFAAVYANGVHEGREGTDFDLQKLGDAAGRKIHERYKDVLKPLPPELES